MKHILSYCLLLAFLAGALPVAPATLIVSDPKNPTSSFQFPYSAHTFSPIFERFFVAAVQPDSGGSFSVAATALNSDIFNPLTPAVVRLNNNADQNNPLFNAPIDLLASFGRRVLATTSNAPSAFFLIDDFSCAQIAVTSADGVADANGLPTKDIIALESHTRLLDRPETLEGIGAFAAVTNQDNTFDGNGSGIAFAELLTTVTGNETSQQTFFNWHLFNAQTGERDGNRAYPLSVDTPALYINDPLTAVGRAADLYWDVDLQRLYVALQVTAGAGSNDGARAILVGALTDGKLTFQPIAPSAVFTSTNDIVGAQGASAPVSLHKIRTTLTSTLLRYLIVLGGNGDVGSTQNTVYAMPLVEAAQSDAHGTLANVNSIPANIFLDNAPYRLVAHAFVVPATQPGDIFTTSSAAAQVGGAVTLPGNITDITVQKDTVFVSTASSGNGLQSGIFYSQAIFDAVGRIKCWTNWARAGVAGQFAAFAFGSFSTQFWVCPTTDDSTFTDVLRTDWQVASPLQDFISPQLPSEQGGVQGFFDFPYQTPGFTTEIGNRISAQLYTGYQKIILLQTGRDSDANFGQYNQVVPTFTNSSASLEEFAAPVSSLVLSGGALENIGPIIAADVVSDGVNGWLVVGGSKGIAFLAAPDGTGWNAATGLAHGFQGLSSTMRFIFSPYKNVRKLISNGNYLYILTQTQLIRLLVTPQSIASGNVTQSVIADARQILGSGTFSDVIISGPFALLATSKGLYRSGNGVDVSIITSSDQGLYTLFVLPEVAGSLGGCGPITRLFAITPTGFEKDLFVNVTGTDAAPVAGNVYVLNACVGLGQAHVYRLTINSQNGIVTDSTVSLFLDMFIQNVPSFFANFGDYRNFISTDGAVFWASRSRYTTIAPILSLLNPNLRAGQGDAGRTARDMRGLDLSSAHSIGLIKRSSSSGNWIVPGDFGVRINN